MTQPFDKRRTDEQGAVAVFFAILLPVIFGFAALVLDLAHGWESRRLLQNCVDGAALAGSYELPDDVAAEAAVAEYLQTFDNGFCLRAGFFEDTTIADPTGSPAGPAPITAAQDADAYSVEVYDNDGDGSLNAVRVTMARGVSTFLAPVAAALLGSPGSLDFMQVRTHAVAIKGDVQEFQGALPMGMIACDGDPGTVTPNAADYNIECPWNDPVWVDMNGNGVNDPGIDQCNVNLNRIWVKSWNPIAESFLYMNLMWALTMDAADTPVKMTIKVNPGGQVSSGNFQSLDFPPTGGGADEFKARVAWGWDGWLGDCDVVTTKTGNMAGPTIDGFYDANQDNNNWNNNPAWPRISRTNRDKPPQNPSDDIPPYQPSPPMPPGGHPDNPVLLDDLYLRVMHDLLDHVDSPWDCPRVLYVPIVGSPVDGLGNPIVEAANGAYDVRILTWAVMFLDNKPVFPPGKAGPQGDDKGFVNAYFFDPQKRQLPPRSWSKVGKLDPNSWLPTGIKLVE